jgi:tetratricopeptide (TPR) repeat protein
METSTFSAGAHDVWLYRFTQPFIILLYIKTFFLPTHLTADTDVFSAVSYYDNRIYLGIILLIAILVIAVLCCRKNTTKPIAFGIFWFLFALFPTSWIALSEALNDHRTFFPYVGLVICVSWASYLLYLKLSIKYSFKSLKFIYLSIIFLAIGLNVYGTYQRNIVWDNETSLWKDVTIKSPKNGRGLMNYGLQLMAIGKYNEAQEYYLKALEFNPRYSNLYTNLGIVSNALGKKNEAEQNFKKGIEFSTGGQSAYLFYGKWLLNENRIQESKIILEKGLSISPNDLELRHKLLENYHKLGDQIKLKSFANETLAVMPNDSISAYYLKLGLNQIKFGSTQANQTIVNDLINQSLGYYNIKQFQKSIETCLEALKYDKNNSVVYNNLCSAYNSIGNFKKGKIAGELAVKFDPQNQLAKNNLNWSIKNIK